jgi:3-dehydroquinate synthase
MSDILPITYEGKPSYDIVLENSYDLLIEKVISSREKPYGKVCIVTDSNVSPLYLREAYSVFSGAFENVITFEIPAGEASKNLKNVQILYRALVENHFDRSDLLVALGGGVIGDMTGFTAATFLRGISFIQMPTTLLSCVDSSIGGKTGVDFDEFKNIVGAFYMPRLVYMNLSALSTLPREQFSSGMAEVIKHGLIADQDYYSFLKENVSGISSLEPALIEKTVKRSCEIKGRVVEEDPKEQGIRAHLNFGHTIGHAIEKLSDFNLFHGYGVSIGSVAASYISMKRGFISEEEFSDIKNTFISYGLPVSVPAELSQGLGITAEKVLAVTKSDKKMEKGKIKFIVLKAVGNAEIDRTVSDEELLDAINYVLM